MNNSSNIIPFPAHRVINRGGSGSHQIVGRTSPAPKASQAINGYSRELRSLIQWALAGAASKTDGCKKNLVRANP